MSSYALSIPYDRRSAPVQSVHTAQGNAGQTGNNYDAKALVVRQNYDTSPSLSQGRSDDVELSSLSHGEKGTTYLREQDPELFLNRPAKQRDWDHKLLLWFRTAFSVQDNPPQQRGLHIDIIV